MKPRPPRRRKTPIRDVIPPDVPEVSGPERPSPSGAKAEPDPIPEYIRRMLEAAYT